jgi:hypothetical protein
MDLRPEQIPQLWRQAMLLDGNGSHRGQRSN